MLDFLNRLLRRKQKQPQPKPQQSFVLIKAKNGLYPIGQQFKPKTNFCIAIGYGPALEEAIANLPDGGKIEITILNGGE